MMLKHRNRRGIWSACDVLTPERRSWKELSPACRCLKAIRLTRKFPMNAQVSRVGGERGISTVVKTRPANGRRKLTHLACLPPRHPHPPPTGRSKTSRGRRGPRHTIPAPGKPHRRCRRSQSSTSATPPKTRHLSQEVLRAQLTRQPRLGLKERTHSGSPAGIALQTPVRDRVGRSAGLTPASSFGSGSGDWIGKFDASVPLRGICAGSQRRIRNR